MKKKKNIYTHDINLEKLSIKNAPSKEFAEIIEKIPYKGYEVESVSDGRKIVIVKPGGKQSFGKIRKEDFFVFIYNPIDKTLWQITHGQIKEYILEKAKTDKQEAIKILRALERVYCGDEPDEVLKTIKLEIASDVTPEALLKAYKWIWGQEDVNYPTGKGRAMSWEGWKKNKETKEWEKTGDGLEDILNNLTKEG